MVPELPFREMGYAGLCDAGLETFLFASSYRKKNEMENEAFGQGIKNFENRD